VGRGTRSISKHQTTTSHVTCIYDKQPNLSSYFLIFGYAGFAMALKGFSPQLDGQ